VHKRHRIRTPYLVVLSCLAAITSARLEAQVEVTATQEDHVSIAIDGQPFSTFWMGHAYTKPFLAPLRSADGLIVTRKFPMEQVEGESRDHPHHKGLFIGYGDVNGINFWEVEAESKTSGSNPSGKGKVQLIKIEGIKSGKKSGTIGVIFDWLDPAGSKVLEERRTMTFYSDPKVRRFDVDVELTAAVPAHFADTKEGFFAIRVADSMAGKNGGIIMNSEGAQTEKDVWGKQAEWADYVGTVAGHKLGILILDNPHNLNHPPHWHARDYGLFAVNPFGLKEFDPKAKAAGGYTLPKGETLRFRYRVIIHPGDTPKKEIAHWYADYAKAGH
jgi:hypothetical protein